MSRLRLIGKRLLIGCASLVAGLVVAEIGLRLIAPQALVTDGLLYEALPGGEDSGPGYRLRPNLWVASKVAKGGGNRVNSLGLRGAEIGAKQSERVLVLGDSFVFGAGVDVSEAVTDQLQKLVPETEFVNAGTPGYGTVRELAWLESFGDDVDLDAVMLCVFVGNDFSDNMVSEPPRVVAGQLFQDAADREASNSELKARALFKGLHLVRMVERRRVSGASRRSNEEASLRPDVDEVARAEGLAKLNEAFARQEAERLAVYLPGQSGDSAAARRIDLAYDLTHLAIDGVVNWCAQRGAELSVVVIPDVLNVDNRIREQALAQGAFANLEDFDLGKLDFERPGREIQAWCASSDVPCLDLTGAFAERTKALRDENADAPGLYLFGDSHWNAAGHAFAAQLISDWRKREIE